MSSPFRATPEYAESVFSLWISAKDAFRLDSSYSDPSSADKYIDWLRNEAVAGRVWISAQGMTVVGLAIMHPDKQEIWYLAVAKAQRRKGIGLSIVSHLQAIYSELEAQAQTPEVVKLFEKCHFSDSGLRNKGYPIMIWEKE